MKELTEKHHGFLVASFYRELAAQWGEQGKQAFVLATWRYGEQRGSRMAQRAIRDHMPLVFSTYRAYGEWVSTQTVKDEGCENRNQPLTYAPDYSEYVLQCPWATQFLEMGLEECGRLYCAHVDKAVVRGFNPYMVFEMPENIYDNNHCLQILKDANFQEGQVFQKKPENIKTFDYHCAHAFYTFTEIITAVFGDSGKTISNTVMKAFEDCYGADARMQLEAFKETDFQII